MKKNVKNSKSPGVKMLKGIYNTVRSAPTRSKKGVSSVIPALLTYPESMIELDAEGENFEGSDLLPENIREELRDASLIADILTTPASKIRKG
jgi:hypothetical protein